MNSLNRAAAWGAAVWHADRPLEFPFRLLWQRGPWRPCLNARTELLSLIDSTLNLGGRALAFKDDAPLMGAVPELDSMGVVSLLTAFEDRLGISVEDDEIDGSLFETFGSLLAFVEGKLTG